MEIKLAHNKTERFSPSFNKQISSHKDPEFKS